MFNLPQEMPANEPDSEISIELAGLNVSLFAPLPLSCWQMSQDG